MTGQPMGFAKNLTFQGANGETIRLHAADLVSITEDHGETIDPFWGAPIRIAPPKITAVLELHRRANGAWAEIAEPKPAEPTPIFDAVLRAAIGTSMKKGLGLE